MQETALKSLKYDALLNLIIIGKQTPQPLQIKFSNHYKFTLLTLYHLGLIAWSEKMSGSKDSVAYRRNDVAHRGCCCTQGEPPWSLTGQ